MSNPLTFDIAVTLAFGCTDYTGGYTGDAYEAFQNGIKTVGRVLESAKKDSSNSQVLATYAMGREFVAAESFENTRLKAVNAELVDVLTQLLNSDENISAATDEMLQEAAINTTASAIISKQALSLLRAREALAKHKRQTA